MRFWEALMNNPLPKWLPTAPGWSESQLSSQWRGGLVFCNPYLLSEGGVCSCFQGHSEIQKGNMHSSHAPHDTMFSFGLWRKVMMSRTVFHGCWTKWHYLSLTHLYLCRPMPLSPATKATRLLQLTVPMHVSPKFVLGSRLSDSLSWFAWDRPSLHLAVPA